MTARVGFVGLGAMGSPMAANLVARGFAVTGFDIRPEAVEALVAAGGAGAARAAEAAAGADILVLMVVNDRQAEEALFEAGALEAMAEDGIVVLMATCAPDAAANLAARVTATGRRFLDAPVSGGAAGAETATLTIMAAGPDGTFEAAKPLLDALGDKVFHVGEEPGQGATVKAVNQLLCGVHIVVAAEGLALAERIGVDPEVVLKILGGSAASSWMLNNRGPRMLMDDPPVMSAVDIFVKDLGIVLEAGRGAGMDLPHAELAHGVYEALSREGKGRLDDSQVIRRYREADVGRSSR
mgnify:CR=1 FL=1